ncbi:MAG: N-acetylmuramoyl-L-alanine amidase [Bacteroidales bacterium]|nr:N-acetylmuramoyl-L-alanine amidase [Bacteroidales bacterium]
MLILKSKLFFLFTLLIFFSNVFAQEPVKVKAKAGDGIHKLLQQNELDPEDYYQEFIELNKSKLIKNDQLVIGQTYLIPVKKASSSIGYAIFGPKYAQVDRIDNVLQGAVYYVVSGHGGPDPGAVGKRNGHLLTEDEYAYDISLRLSRELIKHGAVVYVIVRDPDDGIRDIEYLNNDKHETVWKDKEIPLNVNKKLRQRTQVVNRLYASNKGAYQRLLVLHIDSRSTTERVDVFGYYNSKSSAGKKFTEQLIDALKTNYQKFQPNRSFDGVSKSRNGLYLLKYTHPVTAYLELGNIQNTKDQARFIKVSNRQALAEWLVEGCIADYQK